MKMLQQGSMRQVKEREKLCDPSAQQVALRVWNLSEYVEMVVVAVTTKQRPSD